MNQQALGSKRRGIGQLIGEVNFAIAEHLPLAVMVPIRLDMKLRKQLSIQRTDGFCDLRCGQCIDRQPYMDITVGGLTFGEEPR